MIIDKNQYLKDEIQIAQQVIARHDQQEANDAYRNAYVVGVLRATLASMAGLGKHALHRSCFDLETTQAIQQLLETIGTEPPTPKCGEYLDEQGRLCWGELPQQ